MPRHHTHVIFITEEAHDLFGEHFTHVVTETYETGFVKAEYCRDHDHAMGVAKGMLVNYQASLLIDRTTTHVYERVGYSTINRIR